MWSSVNSWRGMRPAGCFGTMPSPALAEMYAEAVEQAAVETGLDATSFPAKCPWTLDQLLSPELLKE